MPALFNPWALLAAVLLWAASLGGTAWYFDGNGEARAVARQVREDEVRKATFDAAQAGAAAAIAAIKPVNTTIVQKVQREIQTNTVYRDCRLPADGVRLANESLTGRTEPAGAGVVPGAGATR